MPRLRLICVFTAVAVAVGLCDAPADGQTFDPLQKLTTTKPRTLDTHRQLYPIEVDAQWGFIDADGKVVIQPQFETKGQFHDGMAVVTLNGEHGYVTHRGKFMPLPHYERLFPFSGDYARVSLPQPTVRSGPRKFKFTFVDRNGRNISKTLYDNAGDFSEGIARVYLAAGASFEGRFIADSWGFINGRGDMIIRPQFKEVGDFHEGLARVNSQGRWGYIDDDCNMVIEPRFDYAEDFSEGLATVQIGGRRGYINKEGEIVIAPDFEYAGPFRTERAAVARTVTQQFEFINPRGRVVINRKFEAAGDFSDGFARVYETGKWGYINTAGDPVIEPQFDDAHDFNGELALVTIGNAWGYISQTGIFVWRSDGTQTGNSQ